MLNYFDGIFKIVNPKLYNSPYNKNIVKVRDVVKNYGIRCNLRFFFKLLSLKIIESKSAFLNSNIAGLYYRNINTIMIPTNVEENIKNLILDHELFHVGGRIIGSKNFNEGITQNLAKKANDYPKDDLYAYELEVFVVEFLNKIFDDGLYSVFFGNRRLYKYFKKKGLLKQIKSIDKIINLYNNREHNRVLFIKYLYVIKYVSRYRIKGHESKDFMRLIDKFRKEKEELNQIKLDNKTFRRIEKILNDNGKFLYYLVPRLEDCYDCLKEDSFYNKYLEQLQSIKVEKRVSELYFIILILTNIAKKYGYTNEEIYDLVLSLSSDKSSELKECIYAVSKKFLGADNGRKLK